MSSMARSVWFGVCFVSLLDLKFCHCFPGEHCESVGVPSASVSLQSSSLLAVDDLAVVPASSFGSASSADTGGTIKMSGWMHEIHRAGYFRGKLSVGLVEHNRERQLPASVSRCKAPHHYLLNLLDFVCTKEDRKYLSEPWPDSKFADRKFGDFSMEMQQRCLDKLLEFEGCDLTVLKNKDKPASQMTRAGKVNPLGKQVVASVNAMGKRVHAFKDKIRAVSGLEKVDRDEADTPLMEYFEFARLEKWQRKEAIPQTRLPFPTSSKAQARRK
jgi:hypothetical protein